MPRTLSTQQAKVSTSSSLELTRLLMERALPCLSHRKLYESHKSPLHMLLPIIRVQAEERNQCFLTFASHWLALKHSNVSASLMYVSHRKFEDIRLEILWMEATEIIFLILRALCQSIKKFPSGPGSLLLPLATDKTQDLKRCLNYSMLKIRNRQTSKQIENREGYQFGVIENFAAFKKHSATDLSGSNYNIT